MLARIEQLPPERLQTLKPEQLRALVKRTTTALDRAGDPTEIIKVSAMLDAIEDLMHAAGMYKPAEILPVNQSRMYARWKLGRALKKIARRQGQRGRKAHDELFKKILADLQLDRNAAQRAERIAAMPDNQFWKVCKLAEEEVRFLYFNELIKVARPWWYKESREDKHGDIAAAAKSSGDQKTVGPFPLLYADPPWKFEIYSPKGLERTADQHYPTLTDQEIIDFEVDGKTVHKLAHKDAVLFMWCTSSNIKRAIAVMEAWGFTYKTHAMWDKMKSGLGLVFRNQHEVLLYGTRGKMPGPQHQPKSVFRYPRRRHSAKPPEMRKAIEKMYPDFDEKTRLELFSRDKVKGWTCRGFEAD